MRTILVKAALETLTPRVTKNAKALASGGYEVTVLSWDRDAVSPGLEYRDGYQVRRWRFKAPLGPKVLLYLPVWWCFEFLWLMSNRWDMVHAVDLDTVPPAILAAKIKRKPVVYELADIYEDMTPLPLLLRKICMSIDKIFMRQASAMVLVNELGGIPNNNTVVIYNSPPDLFKKLDTPISTTFIIFYAGMLHRSRRANLDRVVMAVRNMENTRLVIAGYGEQVEEIKKWADETPGKVEFIGQISYTEALERTLRANLLFALYEPYGLTVKYASANKLFEAMMCRKPVLVSSGTDMADVVERENCGLVVDCSNTEEIREAIEKLKGNPKLCRELGANGRRAYEQRYSWEIMEQRLLNLYQELR